MAKRGQPTKYKPEYADLVFNACLLGLKDTELAALFNISVATFNNWKIEHPDFLESIKKGKEGADIQVARAMYEAAKGYSHPDTDIRVVANKIVKTKIIKHYPPDRVAGIFWLKNRQNKVWKDKQEIDTNQIIKVIVEE